MSLFLNGKKQVEGKILKDVQWACTFNIFCNNYINGKKWCQYTKTKQINLLARKLQSYARQFDCEIDYNRYVYEQCPTTRQWHVHFVMTGLETDSVGKFAEHANLVNRPAKHPTYITFLAKPLFYDKGWEEYLKKDQDKTV